MTRQPGYSSSAFVALSSNQLTTNTILDFVRDKNPNMRLIAATW